MDFTKYKRKKKVETEGKKKVPHQSTVTATVLAQCKHTKCIVPKHWRFLYIYAGSYKYLKEKKVQTED